jgi:hypothetical protein
MTCRHFGGALGGSWLSHTMLGSVLNPDAELDSVVAENSPS